MPVHIEAMIEYIVYRFKNTFARVSVRPYDCMQDSLAKRARDDRVSCIQAL